MKQHMRDDDNISESSFQSDSNGIHSYDENCQVDAGEKMEESDKRDVEMGTDIVSTCNLCNAKVVGAKLEWNGF